MSATSESIAANANAEGAASACMLCGGTRFVAHFRGGDVPVVQGGVGAYRITHSERRLVRALVRCADCGLVLLPLEHAPRGSYEDAADPYYIEQASQRIANAHRLLDLVPRGGDLLEVGCACGFLLEAARQRGFAPRGVEMSAWASAYARDVYHLDVHTGSIESAALPPESFDVAVMADVIEHLTDPRRTIRHIHRVLRPGGRLLLLTPDVGSAVARLFGPRWWGLLDDHYVYFSRRTLRAFLESEEFAVERIEGLGRVFPVSHWVFKLQPYSRALHAAVVRLTRALRVDERQISINLGDMMACVARKK